MEYNNIKNSKKVENFLNKTRVSGDDPYTHIAMGETFKGKFYLNKQQNKEFTKLYAEAVENGATFNIAEKPKEYGPLLIDVDLEKPSNDADKRLYNNDMIFEIINAYREVSNQYLDLNSEELVASVFEKPKPTKKETLIKDGFHIIFHGIVAHYKLRYLIRNKVVKKLSDSKLFDGYLVEKVIDKAVVNTNGWLLPGSRKKDGQLYELKCIYDKYNNIVDITKTLSNKYKMIRLYSLQDKLREKENETSFINDITMEKIEEEFSNLGSKPPKKVELNNKNDEINTEVDNCLKCLPIDDFNDFEKWRDIALIINNELGYNGLEVLINWSSDGEGFDEVKVEQFYKNIKPKENGLKIGTLKRMAKESNPELYKKLFQKKVINQNDENIQGVFNDLEAAKKVYELYNHWVCCNNELYVFDDKTGLWTTSEVVMFNIISRFDDSLYLLTRSQNDTIKKTTKGYGNSTSLKRLMLPELKTLCINNSWLTNNNLTSMNKILFINGYYEMNTGIFHESFNPEIVFFYRVERKYEVINNNEYIELVKQRFFYNQLGEDVGNYLILNIARSLAGNRMKKIFFNLGETNAGKSTIVNATINSFGDYIGTFNGENLCIKNTTSDEAQLMRWAYLLRYKRIIFSNEMKNESVLSGNMMKKISSGGDTLVGRTHGGEEMPFVPHFNVFCNANDLLEIKPYDSAINDRLNIASYKKKYVEEPSNEYELKKDNNIDNEMRTNYFINTFQYILFNSYLNFYKNGCKEIIPEAVKNCKHEWVGEQAENTCINKFIDSYEITNNVEDFVKSVDIDIWIKENKLNISLTKFSMELKKYCGIKKFNNVESKNKKMGGKVLKVWVGIKLVHDDEDETNNSLDL